MGSTTKSFQLIDAVVNAGMNGATFTEAVRDSGVPKSTAHRLLNELTDIGALRFDEDSKTYLGGLLLARYGASVAAEYDLRKIARPHLEHLNEQTGHTATLGIRDGNHGILPRQSRNERIWYPPALGNWQGLSSALHWHRQGVTFRHAREGVQCHTAPQTQGVHA